MAIINEAEKKEFMTKREEALKKRLIALLRDDGKGHRHAKFADRLKDFIVKIVDSKEDPEMTAAISWDDATIYISDGFLSDPDTFYQLNVLMRHELAHYLLQHQLRMMHTIIDKYGDKGYTHIKMSNSIHELLNIIEDFEISNTRYTDEDKQIVRNMVLNGRVIGGLVTEDIRINWLNDSVEVMYDKLSNELRRLNQDIKDELRYNSRDADTDTIRQADIDGSTGDYDFLRSTVKNKAYLYKITDRPTAFLCTIDEFLADKGLYHFAAYDNPGMPCIVKFSSLPDVYKDIIKELAAVFQDDNKYNKDDLRKLIRNIALTDAIDTFDIVEPRSGDVIITVYTPEEKLLAIDVLKAIIPTFDDYDTWYKKVYKALNNYSQADIQNILDGITKQKKGN